jgi:fibronectin type 3 domain-containing protein
VEIKENRKTVLLEGSILIFKEFCMKNVLKAFGIIAIVALIGFSMSACDDGTNDNGGSNNGGYNSGGENTGGNNNGGNNNSGGNNNGGNNSGGNNNTTTKPGTPTGVTANALSSDTIRVSWSAVSEATSYKVYYSSYSGQENPSLTTTVTTTSYERTSLVSDSTYYFKVAAVNSAGEGTASSIVSTKTNKLGTPGIPTDVTAGALSSSSIRISWSSPSGYSNKPTGYYIYRSITKTESFPCITYTSSLTYTDTGLNASTTYYYLVRATNDNGDGSVSSVASATTWASSGGGSDGGTSVPSAPTGVTATRQSSSNVYITWNAVSGATSYKVYWSYTSSGTYSLTGTTSSTNYTYTGWGASETGYIKVSAVNSAGEGPQSSAASFPAYSSSGGGGGYGTVKVENGGTRSISIFLTLIESTGNSYVDSTTADVDAIRTFSSVPAGKTYRVSVMVGTSTYNSNTFTLSANETVNVMWTGLNFSIY